MDAPCPKCGAKRDGAEACARCGVVFARFDPAALEHDVPEEIRSLWRHAEASWDDRSRHALFVETAVSSGAAGYAAAMYRSRGADDAVAVEQLERISSRLEQELARSSLSDERDAEPRRGRPALYLTAVIIILVFGALGVALVLR